MVTAMESMTMATDLTIAMDIIAIHIALVTIIMVTGVPINIPIILMVEAVIILVQDMVPVIGDKKIGQTGRIIL
jgi:hypothetical protein